MSTESRPLWRLLLETVSHHKAPPLTCADCFSILEYLADIDPNHDEWYAQIQRARQHLATCPDCQTYYQKRLDELEALSGEKEWE